MSFRVRSLLYASLALAVAAASAASERPEPPIHFEENLGQASGPASFLARAASHDLRILATGFQAVDRGGNVVELLWSAPVATPGRLTGLVPTGSHASYLIGSDPAAWVRGARHFERVVHDGLYPGIDVVYYARGGDIEFDFRVAPGADSGRIRFDLRGDGSAAVLADDGGLEVATPGGKLRLEPPLAYEESSGAGRREISARYRLRPDGGIGIEVERAAPDATLVIDPVIRYSTYLGGSVREFESDLVVDAAGNLYVAGITESPDFPATPGAFSSVHSGISDGFVSKFGPDGSLLFSTFVGGSGGDAVRELVVDGAGDIYFVGETDSVDFPTTAGAFQTTFGGAIDVTVGKLSADGTTLLLGTYLGGGNTEATPGLALDAGGHPYVAGQVLSDDFPTTPGAFQPTKPSPPAALFFHAFVTKLDPAVSSLVYSTYLGGTDSSGVAFDLAVDALGHAYVTGSTGETDFPTTPGAFQPAIGDVTCPLRPCSDAYVTKMSVDGAALVYSTYLGGRGSDGAGSIEVDAAGNAYVVGAAEAADFPVSGAVQPANGGGRDGFLTKLDPTGSALVFSTFLGGGADDFASGLDLAPTGDVVVSGRTDSADFPVLDPVQAASAGGTDAWTARFPAAGSPLLWSTYLGGSASDTSSAARFLPDGSVAVAGRTESADFPVTADAFQAAPGGGVNDLFLTVLSDPRERAVGIDVRPASAFNWIVPWLFWPVPVAVLGGPDFDVTRIDPATVAFGPGGASSVFRPRVVDVDGDGYRDLVLRFLMSATGIACGDRSAPLTGETVDGERFAGRDRVHTILCLP